MYTSIMCSNTLAESIQIHHCYMVYPHIQVILMNAGWSRSLRMEEVLFSISMFSLLCVILYHNVPRFIVFNLHYISAQN